MIWLASFSHDWAPTSSSSPLLSVTWLDRTVYWFSFLVWLDCDLECRHVSSAQSDSDLTGRLVCVVVYSFPESIDPRQNSSQWSVCGRFSVALYYTVGMYVSGNGSEWNDSSTCFWRHIYLWITSLCKYFACSKLHPQTLYYHCCCVTLAASFLCFLFCPSLLQFFPLPLYLSRLQFNVSIFFPSLSISLFLCSLLHNRSFCLSVSSICSLPLPPSWCFHWHLWRPVLCQTAILQIKISWVLKSLRQIYYLNGREWCGARGGLV